MKHFFRVTPTSLPALPMELADIRSKLQNTIKAARLEVVGRVSVNSQVVKVKVLEFAARGELVFEQLDHDWVIFYADTLRMNGPIEIRRTSAIDLTGEHGKDGADGQPPANNYGAHGNPGQPGGWGLPGQSQPVPNLYIFCQEILWKGAPAKPSDIFRNAHINFSGYPGGVGGNGGKGGNGTDGREGTPAREGWIDCASGPGWGGNGGNAGPPGIPGMGGDGTDGAAIFVFVPGPQIVNFQEFSYNVTRGRAGDFGKYGDPGTPGNPGREGHASGNCGGVGRFGQLGGNPIICNVPDISPRSGVDGPMPEITDYVGFPELSNPADAP